MTIVETENSIIRDILELGDTLSRSEFLIRCGRVYSGIPESERREEDMIRDCQVRTWVNVSWEKGILRFSAHSESLIVKGALSLFDELYNGRTESEIVAYNSSLKDMPEFLDLFTQTQQKGIRKIIDILSVSTSIFK